MSQPTDLEHFKQELRPHLGALLAAFGALVGAGVFFGLPFDPWWGLGLVVTGFGLLGMGLAQKREIMAVAVGFMVAGMTFSLAGWQVQRAATVDFVAGQKPHWIVGRVTEVVVKVDNPARVTLRMDNVRMYGLGIEKTPAASIGVYKSQLKDVEVGGYAALPVVLMAPEGPKFDGQRDARLWRYFENGRVTGYVLGGVEPTWVAPERMGGWARFMVWIEGIRKFIYLKTQTLAGGAVAALLIGEEKGISAELREAYRATGLSHLLAISGMQMTLVALGVFGLLRWLGALVPWVALRFNVRLWAACGSLTAVVGYVFLAGAGVSLVRAGIMSGIVMIAVLTGRMRSALRGWCVAVVLILMVNPLMVTRAGFQLSIAAVLGLLLLAMTEREVWKGGLRGWARELVLATVVAGCATAPLLVLNFGQFTVLGMLANLVAVPVMSLATYLGMVALLVWPLGLEGGVLQVMGLVVGWVNDWALWLSGVRLATVAVEHNLWWVVTIGALVVIGSVLLKRWAEAAVGLMAMTAVVVIVAVTTPKPEVMVWEDGKIGMVKEGQGYKLLWAEDLKEAARLVKIAGIQVDMSGEVPKEIDERLMPVTPYEHFAWAQKTRGVWHVEPVACGRVWQRMDGACAAN